MENHDQSNHNSQSEQRKIWQATSENSSRPSARFVLLGGVRTPVKRSIEVKPMQCRSLSAPEFKSLCPKNYPNIRSRLCLTYFTALEDSSACFMEVFLRKINPLTPMSDQGWITPYTEFWNNIKQTSDENKKKKTKLGDYQLIQYQILQNNIMRIVWQTVRRITNMIVGVEGWNSPSRYDRTLSPVDCILFLSFSFPVLSSSTNIFW